MYILDAKSYFSDKQNAVNDYVIYLYSDAGSNGQEDIVVIIRSNEFYGARLFNLGRLIDMGAVLPTDLLKA